jgi:hypothetical protein
MKRKIGWVMAVVGVAFLVVNALSQEKGRQITIEKLQDIQNPESEFNIELWTDREDCNYKIGEQVVFFFKTNRDCRLTLFNIATSGEVLILFPNAYHSDNLVKAGETYRIPPEGAKFIFRVKGPAGEDVVKAIATLENVPLVNEEDVQKTEEGLNVITKGEKSIAVELYEALKPVNPKRWAEAEKTIKVMEGRR